MKKTRLWTDTSLDVTMYTEHSLVRGPRGAWAIRLEFLHMKLRLGLAAFASLALAAGCTMAAKEEDDALVKAGFAKTSPSGPGAASIAKSNPIVYLHFVHRTVNGVPKVFYYDPVACKCVYSGTEAQFAAYKQAQAENQDIYDQIDLHPP
jgi:hypothetical protein